MARSRIVGIPSGRCVPLALGMNTRRSGDARYPRRSRSCAAFHFDCGVVQRLPSTPAVLLPRFSVTRRTARSLAEVERVSIRWRAFTFRQLPFLQAFAIRICIARTVRCTRHQSIWCQFCGRWESADVGCSRCSTMLPSSPRIRAYLSLHAMKDQVEVGSLSRRVMFQPVSRRLQPGLRFLHHPIPAPPTALLTVCLPGGQRYGLTTFLDHHTTGLGPVYPPVATLTTCPHYKQGHPATYRLVSAYQLLWHLKINDVYQQFTCVAHASQPSASSRFSFEDRHHCLTAMADTLRWATFRKSFRQIRYQKCLSSWATAGRTAGQSPPEITTFGCLTMRVKAPSLSSRKIY